MVSSVSSCLINENEMEHLSNEESIEQIKVFNGKINKIIELLAGSVNSTTPGLIHQIPLLEERIRTLEKKIHDIKYSQELNKISLTKITATVTVLSTILFFILSHVFQKIN